MKPVFFFCLKIGHATQAQCTSPFTLHECHAQGLGAVRARAIVHVYAGTLTGE